MRIINITSRASGRLLAASASKVQTNSEERTVQCRLSAKTSRVHGSDQKAFSTDHGPKGGRRTDQRSSFALLHSCFLFISLVLNLHWPSLLAGKWPDRHQTCTRWTPGQRASRVCLRSRSKVTWYGHFCVGRKIACSPRQMTGSRRQVCNLTFLLFQ